MKQMLALLVGVTALVAVSRPAVASDRDDVLKAARELSHAVEDTAKLVKDHEHYGVLHKDLVKMHEAIKEFEGKVEDKPEHKWIKRRFGEIEKDMKKLRDAYDEIHNKRKHEKIGEAAELVEKRFRHLKKQVEELP